jgi:hypothetical protein
VPQSRIRVNSPQVISEHIDGETVMINLQTGAYYSLNSSGARIWGLLPRDHGVLADEVVRAVRSEQAETADLAAQVTVFLDQLLDEQLVVPVDADGAHARPSTDTTTPPAMEPTSQPWEAPSLTRFDDMQDLLVLDPVHEVDERGWPHLPSDDGA